MNERYLLIAGFAAGVLLQAAFLVRNDIRLGKLLLCVVMGAAGFLPGKHEQIYDPLFHIIFALSFFSFFFAFTFKDDLLPQVTEPALAYFSMLLAFAIASYSPRIGTPQIMLLAAVAVAIAATMVLIYRCAPLSFVGKLSFYSWFLATIFGLGLYQFPFRQLNLFSATHAIPWVTPLESASAGMAFLYLTICATYLFLLIPIPGKNQSWSDRMKEWHELTNSMTIRMDDGRRDPGRVAFVLAAVALVLTLDAYRHWMSPGLIINLLIVMPSVVAYLRRVLPARVSTLPPAPRHPPTRDRDGTGR